jgi:hypothetical protein
LAYRQIAVVLLKNLFAVDFGDPRPAPTLERLIGLWNQIQETLEAKLNKGCIKHRHTFYWEEAMQHGIIDSEDVRRITELRMIRNSQVHSVNPDRKDIEHAVHLAETLLERLRLQ